ncbi:MAG: TIGR04222 domain-containing membrane protein, partial [Planctomycetota bacterium]
MRWLFENPLANMPGPAFLGLFGALLAGAVVILRVMAARIEEGDDSRPLPIPPDIDPYQIAFLRGGDTEVIRTALVDLVEQGRIIQVEKTGFGKILANSQIQWEVADPTDTGADLSPIQRTLLQTFAIPKNLDTVFQPDIRSKVHEHTKPFRDWV